MPMSATLTVMGGLPDQAGRVYEIGPATTTLGRGLGCDIQLPDQGISRMHAELVWEGESLILVHLSQVNRTLVNGREISGRAVLVGGEEIQFADRVVLRVKLEAIAEPATPPAEPLTPIPTPAATSSASASASTPRPLRAPAASPSPASYAMRARAR